jgi:rusticyanin
MNRREAALGAALVAVLAVGAGYAIGHAAEPPAGRAAASPSRPTPTSTTGTGSPMPTATPTTGAGQQQGMPPESATGYSNNQLAQFIAEQAGSRLARSSPSYVSASSARALDSQVPPGARADARTDTITFASGTVSFTVVAVPPSGPDMTFRIGGLVNPTLVVPFNATVRVRFINADSDQAHGWEVTADGPPFEFGLGQPALAGALARPLGDPTAAGYGTESITFRAGRAGRYQYACPMPGHAQMGMHGAFVVR